MKLYFKRAEMEEYLPEIDLAGEVHVNHVDCPAGRDTRKRLYIKTTPDAHLFYCHHCQMRGYYRTTERLHRISEIIEPNERVEEIGVLNTEMLESLNEGVGINNVDEWPIGAKLWWLSYELDQSIASRNHVQWFKDRLWLNAQGNCWQGRLFINDWSKHTPATTYKYLTIKQNDGLRPEWSVGNFKTVVLVEDIVSAYKIHAAGYNAMCMMGCKVSEKLIPYIAAYSDVVVWFDEDDAGFTGSLQAVRQLSPICNVRRITYYQPKETPFKKIKEMIDA